MIVESFARWLADFYLLATLLLLAALAASWLVSQPARRVALARATLTGLALLALLCALPGWSVVHLITRDAEAIPIVVAPEPLATEVAVVLPPVELPMEAAPVSALPVVESAPASIPVADSAWREVSVSEVAVGAYLIGTLFVVVWQLLGHWRAWVLLRDAVPASLELQQMLRELHEQGSKPGLFISPALPTAAALGTFRPTILLPRKLVESTDSTALRTILAHELAHIRHGDLRLLALCRALFVLLWANPLFWLLRRRLRLDQETLADAAAAEVTTRHRYAEQLVDWAKRFATDRPPALAAAVGLWESPSQLRRRIAVLLDERLTIWRECSRRWRIASLAVCAGVAVGLSLVTLEPGLAEPEEPSEKVVELEPSNGKVQQRTELPIVVAKHVVLIDGKDIVSWHGLEETIAAMPDPSLVHPSFYVTRGAREAGLDDFTKLEIRRLRQRFNFRGHSEGSLWPRADLRYDRIEDESGLTPDESLRVAGQVVDHEGKPVAGAEVILITPIDESISYRTHNIALVEGRLRNRLEEVVTDSDTEGRFAVYPPKDEKSCLVVIHPTSGFKLLRVEQLADSREVKLLPWAALITELGEEPNLNQNASLQTRIPSEDGFSEIVISQYWGDIGDKKATKTFGFTQVPPIFETTISRNFAEGEGVSIGLAGASVGLLPGESRRLDLGPLSEKQRERLNDLREHVRQRMEESRSRKSEDESAVAIPATTQPNRITSHNGHETIGDYFILCPVTTNLQRSLLGDVSKPATDVSLCVFVNGMAFTDDQIDAGSPEFVKLKDRLEEIAKTDNRRVVFRVIVFQTGQFQGEKKQQRADTLSQLCERLGRDVGFKRSTRGHTFTGSDFDWTEFIADARAVADRATSDVEDAVGDDRVQVFPVRTFLSRLLVDADCVVNIVPVLGQKEGNRFPDDFGAEMMKFVPQVNCEETKMLLIRVRFIEAAKGRLEQAANDIEGKKLFAKQLGFENCNLSQSPIYEAEKTPKPAADAAQGEAQANTISGRCVDENENLLSGVKIELYRRDATTGQLKLFRETKSGTDGNFRFDHVVDVDREYPKEGPKLSEWTGPILMFGSMPGRTTFNVRLEPTPIALAGQGGDYQLPKSAMLSGRVIDAKGKAVEGVKVTFVGKSPVSYLPTGTEYYSSTTNNRGEYKIDDLAPFDFRAEQAKSENFAREIASDLRPSYTSPPWVAFQHPRFAAKRLAAQEIPGSLDAKLETGAAINGQAVDSTGKPVARALIQLRAAAPVAVEDFYEAETVTDASGHFRFYSVPANVYQISGFAKGLVAHNDTKVTATSGQTVASENLVFTPGATIQIQCVDAKTGDPIRLQSVGQATIVLTQESERGKATVVLSGECSRNGKVAVNAPPGDWRISASISNILDGRWTLPGKGAELPIVTAVEGETVNVRVPLTKR